MTTSRVELLRRAFDQSFAEPVAESRVELERFLAIAIGEQEHAIRLAEIGGLFTARKIVPVPSAVSELSGIVGLRGALVPVYALSALLGHSVSHEPVRWFVTVGTVGFSFSRFDGYVQAATGDVVAGRDANGVAHETLQVAGRPRPIVTLAAMVERIVLRVRALEHKE